MRIATVGGGMIGLCAGMLLAEDGHAVTLLERDPAPPPAPAQSWTSWERRGVNQFRLPNFFPSGFRMTAETELPGLIPALSRAGACRYNVLAGLPEQMKGGTRPDDHRFDVVTGRRPVLESVTARLAQGTPNLVIRRGAPVRRLLTGTPLRAGTPHVTGVELDNGERIEADLVVDAGGRRSRLPQWITDIGGAPPREETDDSGFVYFARHFRSDDGSLPVLLGPLIQEYGSISVLTLPADNGTWSVSIVGSSRDTELRALRDPQRWRAAVQMIPAAAHWIDAKPIDDNVAVIAKIEDRVRDYAPRGDPVATGVVAIGDSWSCTNPSLGRGVSIGLAHSVLLRNLLRGEAGTRDSDLGSAFWEMTRVEMEPWYRSTNNYDRHRLAQMHAGIEGVELVSTDPEWNLTRALQAQALHDGDLLRCSLELAMALRRPDQVLADPLVRRRLHGCTPPGRPQPAGGPSRDHLNAVLGSP